MNRRDVCWGIVCLALLFLTFYLKLYDMRRATALLAVSERAGDSLRRIKIVDRGTVFSDLKGYIEQDPIPFDLSEEEDGRFRCVMECRFKRCEEVLKFLIDRGFSIQRVLVTGLPENGYRCDLLLKREI